jgi:hypothetical protein
MFENCLKKIKMETQNQQTPKLTAEQKGETQANESKPVGYGSSIQSDGHGNRTRPQNQEDVNPTTQQDHIQEIKDGNVEESDDKIPNTNGTGSNNPVSNGDSLIIED